MDDSFCVSALERALERALRLNDKPTIFSTDLGSRYIGLAFTGAHKNPEIRISTGGNVRVVDNVFVERL